MKREPTFKTEADLCAAFIEWAKDEGYTSYPETAGFDILLVDRDGWQIGVQAKLRMNVHVITQVLPYYGQERGPDHRAVLVPELDGGYRELCGHVGLEVFYCTTRGREWKPRRRFTRDDYGRGGGMFDWNPVRRCELPDYMPDVPAGVPAPIQLTPWKIGALKILAHIEIRGAITRQEISRYGVDPRRWCNGDQWLVPLDGEPKRGGRWVRGPKLPGFEKQHPVVYVQIKTEMLAAEAPVSQDVLTLEGAA